MWFSPVILSVALQALPPCELPNLDQPYGASAFEVKTLADGNFGIAMVDPMGDNDERLPGTPEGPAPARPHSERSVWVWSEASGWLLAPKGLKVTAAGVGVDGSWVIEMSHAQAPGRLRASSSGSCVGCAYSSGAPYFDAYLQAARENEFRLRGLGAADRARRRLRQSPALPFRQPERRASRRGGIDRHRGSRLRRARRLRAGPQSDRRAAERVYRRVMLRKPVRPLRWAEIRRPANPATEFPWVSRRGGPGHQRWLARYDRQQTTARSPAMLTDPPQPKAIRRHLRECRDVIGDFATAQAWDGFCVTWRSKGGSSTPAVHP